MPHYNALTVTQKSQVTFLFCDEIFGTDPTLYDYELVGQVVKGRVKIEMQSEKRDKTRVSASVSVMVMPFITDEMLRRRDAALRSLAKRIVERMVEQNVITNS
jgi:hypothetical protein